MPDIPNTDNMHVVTFAIAWEIVKLTHLANIKQNGDEDLKLVTNAVIKAQRALYNADPIV